MSYTQAELFDVAAPLPPFLVSLQQVVAVRLAIDRSRFVHALVTDWVPTDVKGRFEALFRFYGPDKPLFDKTWILPDIEKIA